MTSPPGASDPLGALHVALTDDERAALAAWAEDGDVPDGFEDRVVAAWLSERLGDAGGPAQSGVEAGERGVAEAAATTARTVGGGRVVRLVGFCAAVAAAAAVLLMVRVPPRASEVEPARAVAAADRAVRADAAAEPEPDEPEPTCETLDARAAEATLVAVRYCSPCHDSADRDANPGAVGIFDLQQQEWWSFMSDSQLEGARRRAQMLVEGSDATEDEERKLDSFLARQLEPPSEAG